MMSLSDKKIYIGESQAGIESNVENWFDDNYDNIVLKERLQTNKER